MLERVRGNLKRYRTSVLQAACEGRLVENEAELARAEGRQYEPADELLERILKERKKTWERSNTGRRSYRSYKEPVAPDVSELPPQPEGWTWATLSQISHLKGGVTKGKRYKEGQLLKEIPYLRVANVQHGYLDLSDIKTIEVPQETIDQLRLKEDDILFTEGGDRDKLGRGWVWRGEIDNCIHQNHVFRSRLILDSIRSEFVSLWGNSFGRDFFMKGGKQTTNLASISLTLLSQFPISIPPVPEQDRILAELDHRLSIVQNADNAVAVNLRRAEMLRQSILRQAFSGSLVPQDPTDEPASELLKRIRAERAEAQAASGADRRGRRRARRKAR